MSIAWRLAQAGCPVTVFDRDEAGRGSSWAAAGMLAAAVETEPGEEALLALTLESQRMWPGFVLELQAASGISVGYRDDGTLVIGCRGRTRGAENRICGPAFPAQSSAREIIKSITAGWSEPLPRRLATPVPYCTSTIPSERWRSPAAV